MNFLNILSFIFLLFLTILLIKNRKEVKRESIFFIWRTKYGIKLMDRFAKFLKKYHTLTDILVYCMFFTCFFSFIYIIYYLTVHTFKLLVKETSIPGVSLVIPGMTKIGNITIPFWTILILFIIIFIHEFGHGVFARLYNLKIKSTGLVFLAIIPGAFVELDEKKLENKKLKEKIAILCAGPFFNIVLGSFAFLIIFLSNLFLPPISYKGIYYASFVNNSLTNGTLYAIDDIPIHHLKDVHKILKNKKIGDIVTLNTSEGIKKVKIRNISGRHMLGINVWTDCSLADNKSICIFQHYFIKFFYFLFIFSLGIGLANLLPFLFLDGGKISYFILKELRLLRFFVFLNIFIAILLLINLLYPLYSKFI